MSVNIANEIVPIIKKLDDRKLKNGGGLEFPIRVPYTNVYILSLENMMRVTGKESQKET